MRSDLKFERKVWLLKHPGVVQSISREMQVSASLIYQVLRGAKRSARVAAALAAAGAPGFEESSHEKHLRRAPTKKTSAPRTR